LFSTLLVGRELPHRLLQLGERLELHIEPSCGGGEAVELADECGGQGRDGEGGHSGIEAAGEEVVLGRACS
jgi:hypothetical protein